MAKKSGAKNAGKKRAATKKPLVKRREREWEPGQDMPGRGRKKKKIAEGENGDS